MVAILNFMYHGEVSQIFLKQSNYLANTCLIHFYKRQKILT